MTKMPWILLLFLSAGSVQAVDVLVDDRPLVSRVALQKTPSRGIAVGYPSQFNAVLDSVTFTPLYAWNGGFLNVDGELRGRGGRACSILGPRIDLQLPAMPLRFGAAEQEPKSIVFKGYRRNGYEPPVFLATIDGHSVGLRIVSRVRNQVTLELDLPKGRCAPVYFLTAPLKKSEVIPSPGLTWADGGKYLVIPVSADDASITLDLSHRKSVVMEKEKMTGKLIYQQYCSACHALDDHKLIGPTFKGLWGKKERVRVGGTFKDIQVDADYLRRSILEPQAEIVEGYEAVIMPPFKGLLTPEEINLFIEFIRTGK